MSRVEEISKAIAALPHEEFWQLTDRLVELRDAAWDRQIDEDVSAGRLDALWKEAEAEFEDGETMGMSEFLRHQDVPK